MGNFIQLEYFKIIRLDRADVGMLNQANKLKQIINAFPSENGKGVRPSAMLFGEFAKLNGFMTDKQKVGRQQLTGSSRIYIDARFVSEEDGELNKRSKELIFGSYKKH